MRWANFLHIYQPAGQQSDILEAIVNQSYRPLLAGIKKNPTIRLTFNISGALLELLDQNQYYDLLDILKNLIDEGRLELTGSAKYHAFLPFIDDSEINRQIKANEETIKYFFGSSVKLKGFFPPEMAYDQKIVNIISELGYQWIILDEIACKGDVGQVDYHKIYQIKGSNLKVFFRERRLSNLIMSAVVRTRQSLIEVLKTDLHSGKYLVTAMDGETFGHHRPGLEKTLFKVFATPQLQLIKISEIADFYHDSEEIEPVKSTWATSKLDIEQGIQFLSWSDPDNPMHRWQWELTNLTLNEVKNLDQLAPSYQQTRHKMDIALASDHFWWASAKPWWSLEMIEDGAYKLLDTLRSIPDLSSGILNKANDLYQKIISTAFEWQRTGKIRQMEKSHELILRIPFKERTLGKGGAEKGVYYAFIDMMRGLEKKAAGEGEYEKAILWRDAVYKLENKLDIYDTINAIDLLRTEIPFKEVEETIKRYKIKYRRIRGGQPEQRGN